MTLDQVQKMVKVFAHEHRYDLSREEREVSSRIVRDTLTVTVWTFPDRETGKARSVSRTMDLASLCADPAIRDPAVGLDGYVAALISEMSDELSEGDPDAVQGEQGQGGLQGDDAPSSPGDEQEAADGEAGVRAEVGD